VIKSVERRYRRLRIFLPRLIGFDMPWARQPVSRRLIWPTAQRHGDQGRVEWLLAVRYQLGGVP
jgi:hypothetical protein